MENPTLNNNNREFVWEISKTPKMKAKTPKNEASLVKEMVEKKFQALSTILFDKIHSLESELRTIKQQNTQLENQLEQVSTTNYTEDFVYNPWYL